MNNKNRVKSITSKFEDLSDSKNNSKNSLNAKDASKEFVQNKCVDNSLKVNSAKTDEDLCCRRTFGNSLKVNNSKTKEESRGEFSSKRSVGETFKENLNLKENINVKDELGLSYNFGNRKRLKERCEEDVEGESVVLESRNRLRANSAFDDSLGSLSRNDDLRSSLVLSRQFSDPAKKLQRSPAFRCDKSEKLKDSRKNSVNSDTSEDLPTFKQDERSKLSKDKLKKLGLLLEEKMKNDNFEFAPKSSSPSVLNGVSSDSNGATFEEKKNESFESKETNECRETIEKVEPLFKNVVPKESIIPKPVGFVSNVLANSGRRFSNGNVESKIEARGFDEDGQIPQHILDQYAQVIKPKNRNAFTKKSPLSQASKIEAAVFSDSGVSSESENLISDDLEDGHIVITPKNKNFKTIRENFESKNLNKSEEAGVKKRSLKRLTGDETKKLQKKESIYPQSLDSRNDGQINTLSDTLKKVLKQPLPDGPPPKKPPRTFAAIASPCRSPEPFPEHSISQNVAKKISPASKSPKSKEVSKMMLDKIEFALYKHENGGKILSPSSTKKLNKESMSRQQNSVDKVNTQPSKSKSSPDKNPKDDVHYMCTEIFDLNFSDTDKMLHCSNTSLNSSSEIFNTSNNSFTKCFNSLNCANKIASKIGYTKFGSIPSSRNSLSSVCCNCTAQRSPSTHSMEDFSRSTSQNVTLSTFCMPNKSTVEIDANCKNCGLNERKDGDQFRCHLGCTCKINNAKTAEGNSTFFINDSTVSDASDTQTSQYGSLLKKSTSQEHIYAEPFELFKIRKDGSKDIGDAVKNVDAVFKPPPFLRTRTQLEDGFGKIREINTSAMKNKKDNRKSFHDFASFNYNQTMNENKKSDVFATAPFVRSKTQLEDGFGKLNDNNAIKNFKKNNKFDENFSFGNKLNTTRSSRSKSEEKDEFTSMETYQPRSTVKDILSRFEGNRRSLRADLNGATKDGLYAKRRLRNDAGKIEEAEMNFEDGEVDTSKKGLHYMSSKIYDIPSADSSPPSSPQFEDSNSEQNTFQNAYGRLAREPMSLPANSSFLHSNTNQRQDGRLQQNGGLQQNGRLQQNGDTVKQDKMYEKSANKNSKSYKVNNSGLYNIYRDSDDKSGDSLFNGESVRKPPVFGGKSGTLGSASRPNTLELGSRNVERRRGRSSPTEADRQNLNRLMTEIYDTVAEACIMDSPSKEEANADVTELAGASLKLTRSLTEKRKKYVRRVSSMAGFLPPHSLHPPAAAAAADNTDSSQHYATFPARAASMGGPAAEAETARGGGLYDVCVLVGVNGGTGLPYVKSVYPEGAVLPPQVELLIFPECRGTPGHRQAVPRLPQDVQSYSLVLTNEKGSRAFGYCRRVLPEGAPLCLPLAYCLITKHRVPAYYHKVLQEIESHHGSSDAVMKSVLGQLFRSQLPRPGYSISITQPSSPQRLIHRDPSLLKNTRVRSSLHARTQKLKQLSLNRSTEDLSSAKDWEMSEARRNSTDCALSPNMETSGISNVLKSLEKIYGTDLKEFQKNCLKDDKESKSDAVASGDGDVVDCVVGGLGDLNSWSDEASVNEAFEDDGRVLNASLRVIQIKRPLETRLDEENLSVLLDSISVGTIMKIFGTLLIERKVVLVGNRLSQLSSCIEALQSMLYPLCWQHTLISCVPEPIQKDILEAPIPILAGLLLEDASQLKDTHLEEGMLIDISPSVSGPSERILELQGDEASLLPPLLAKTLKTSLQLGPPIPLSSTADDLSRKTRNVLIAEAFLRFFVELLGDYQRHVGETQAFLTVGQARRPQHPAFQRDQFIRSAQSKHVQYFLEWFTETSMFTQFIRSASCQPATSQQHREEEEQQQDKDDALPCPDYYELFRERVAHRECTKKVKTLVAGVGGDHAAKTNYKSVLNKKVKVWRDKLRDLVN